MPGLRRADADAALRCVRLPGLQPALLPAGLSQASARIRRLDSAVERAQPDVCRLQAPICAVAQGLALLLECLSAASLPWPRNRVIVHATARAPSTGEPTAHGWCMPSLPWPIAACLEMAGG